MAATDSAGFPTRPAANELIESAWGSAVRDRLFVKRLSGIYSDVASIPNAVTDLIVVTIPTQAVNVIVDVRVVWQVRMTGAGGGWCAGDIIQPPTGGATFGVGPVDCTANTSLWTSFSMLASYNVAAGAVVGYKVRVTPTAATAGVRCVAMTQATVVTDVF